mmetsp:Transcript_39448/g.37895  ORF Transcript_39448/g.37895 Transcript_39448/m.37895 type:complete len:197 (+) Transcript_39448:229-819(+)
MRELEFEIAKAALQLEFCDWYCVQVCVNQAFDIITKAECLNECGCYDGNYDHLMYQAGVPVSVSSLPANSLQSMYSAYSSSEVGTNPVESLLSLSSETTAEVQVSTVTTHSTTTQTATTQTATTEDEEDSFSKDFIPSAHEAEVYAQILAKDAQAVTTTASSSTTCPSAMNEAVDTELSPTLKEAMLETVLQQIFA